jgi:hypothetical protein
VIAALGYSMWRQEGAGGLAIWWRRNGDEDDMKDKDHEIYARFWQMCST